MRRQPRRVRLWVVGGVALGLSGGCGPGGEVAVSGSSSRATVQGTVKIQGKLAKGCEITFDPANVKRRDAPMTRAKISDEGHYEVETLVGVNSVTVDGPPIKKANLAIANRKQFDVQSGANEYNIEIP